MKPGLLLLCLGLLPSALAAAPKAVVLVISDGTGMALLQAAKIYHAGANGKMAWDTFPQTAFVSTHSQNNLTTDSAAAATAMARGRKTRNQALGVDENGADLLPALTDIAKQRGRRAGVITTDSITGATPAAFIVEQPLRKDYPEIAAKTLAQLVSGKRIDLAIGGGLQWFRDTGNAADYEPGQQITVQENGKSVAAATSVHILTDLGAVQDAKDLPLLGLLAPDTMPYLLDDPGRPPLPALTAAAVRLLSAGGQPYFLMVEAGLPDKAAHANRAKAAIYETIELSETLDWLVKNLPADDSLIVATADHETGGIALSPMVRPVSMGEGAVLLPDPATKYLPLTFASGPGLPDTAAGEPLGLPNDRQPSLIRTGSAAHTAAPVWLVAQGQGAEKFHGFLDNTDIFAKLREVMEDTK